MRELPVSYEQEAIADLENVRFYILNISKNALVAERYMRRLLTFCERIGVVPNGGYPMKRRRHRSRVFEGAWIVIYRVTAADVQIVRVVSGRRDLRRYRR